MERFWTLQYLRQNSINEIEGSLFRDNMVRADALPLVLPVLGATGMPRGARVRVRLGDIDDITLDVVGTVLERLDASTEPGDPGDGGADGADDDTDIAGPIAIAMEIDETQPGSEDNPAS
jgi:exoribonuclease-2